MRVFSTLVVALGFGSSTVRARGLATEISIYPNTSTFRALLERLPGGLETILPPGVGVYSHTGRATVLVPDDDAFIEFDKTILPSISDMSVNESIALVRYHVLATDLLPEDVDMPGGPIIPTALYRDEDNNRPPSEDLINKYGPERARGQVVYVSRSPTGLTDTQHQPPQNRLVRGGRGVDAAVEWHGGGWELGYIHINKPWVGHSGDVGCWSTTEED